jgi:4'-phosphopantetheinyl transferase
MTAVVRWNPPPPPGLPPDAAVHLWRADLDLPAERLDALATLLSADEWRRAGRARHDQHRTRFIAARGQLRELLGRYLHADPRRIQFTYNPFGKPCLAGPASTAGLSFNLAHTAGLALLAVCRHREVGVDVEYLRPMANAEAMVGRYFAPAEQDEYARVPDAERLRAFFLGWTRKEAFVKALGNGLQCPLDSFTVSLTPGRAPALCPPAGDDRPWTLHHLQPCAETVAAVVVAGPAAPPVCFCASQAREAVA